MIKGLVYLTGFTTLALAAVVAAAFYRVHTWPWDDYIHDGREYLVGRLEPGADAEADASPETPAAEGPEADGSSREAAGGEARSEERPEAEPAPVRHLVGRGDTLYALARRYYGNSMRWQVIARANGIRRARDLRVGKTILIPAERTADAGGEPGASGEGARFVDMSLAFWPAWEPAEGEVVTNKIH